MDVHSGEACNKDESHEGVIRAWARRLQQARGVIPGTLNRLTNELPKVSTPWERVLREYLCRYSGRRTCINHARPSRRWLVMADMLARSEGLALPFEADRSRPGPAGRIAVAVDTSGSIEDTVLARFGGEVAAIMGQTGSHVLLIVCDAAVGHVEELSGPAGQRRLRELRYPGGGGTDFRPAIAAAAAWHPDVMVYLTDLMGEAGEAPSFPLLWAIPPGQAPIVPPWGEAVTLT
jgi:predicted metal-dependent peptidase